MAPRVIDLNGSGLQKQSIAGGVITPGDLLERTSTGTVVRHAVAAGNALRLFAIENELQGNGIDVDYAANDTLQMMHFPPGGVVNAISSAAIAVGDFVESDGAGRVRVLAASAATSQAQRASVIGVALTAAAGAGERVQVEIL